MTFQEALNKAIQEDVCVYRWEERVDYDGINGVEFPWIYVMRIRPDYDPIPGDFLIYFERRNWDKTTQKWIQEDWAEDNLSKEEIEAPDWRSDCPGEE